MRWLARRPRELSVQPGKNIGHLVEKAEQQLGLLFNDRGN